MPISMLQHQSASFFDIREYSIHGVHELLLEHWEEFSTCLRLKGPKLLEITALYAELESQSTRRD